MAFTCDSVTANRFVAATRDCSTDIPLSCDSTTERKISCRFSSGSAISASLRATMAFPCARAIKSTPRRHRVRSEFVYCSYRPKLRESSNRTLGIFSEIRSPTILFCDGLGWLDPDAFDRSATPQKWTINPLPRWLQSITCVVLWKHTRRRGRRGSNSNCIGLLRALCGESAFPRPRVMSCTL